MKSILFVFEVVLFVSGFHLIESCNYRTETDRTWNQACGNSNGGCFLNSYFATVFPNGASVGNGYTLQITSADNVRAFFPQRGSPGPLSQNYTNPSNTTSGSLGSHLMALKMNIGYGKTGGFSTCVKGLDSVYLCDSRSNTSCPGFYGSTIGSVFTTAASILGNTLTTSSSDLATMTACISWINTLYPGGATAIGTYTSTLPCS